MAQLSGLSAITPAMRARFASASTDGPMSPINLAGELGAAAIRTLLATAVELAGPAGATGPADDAAAGAAGGVAGAANNAACGVPAAGGPVPAKGAAGAFTSTTGIGTTRPGRMG